MTLTEPHFLRCSPANLPRILALFLSLALLPATALAQTEARVYELQSRPADDVAQQIRELYQNAPVTVTARGQQVVVRGEQPLLDEIGMLIDTMDVAPAQLRITVRSRQDIGGKRSGAGVSGSEERVNVTVERKVTSTNNSQLRTLVVQDGQSAHITSGQVRTLPFAVQGGRNPAAILQQVETRSGFLVSPQVISDRAIEVSIVSFEEDPAALPGYETEAVVTIRRVEPGEWVALGSTSTSADTERSGITYNVSSSRSDNRSFEIKVDILR
ncbi:secretin N-terminal domain-containing protein [Marinobacter alexandrii]|uniref:secretin N-terminal domain-containing protein n=1 Tax=Marinobacter alexandrii TaxID=2570351 RepID=UPI0011090DF8|nr:secretin N-terminal domain-containing protein [Marinobacter alexandrii]